MVHILAADETPLIPPLGEIIIGIIAFSVVVIVMMRLVAPRFEQVFRARREAIEGGIERAEAMQAEAREALERYRAQLAEARTEAAQIRDQARAEGQQILEELRAQAQEESARILARGEELLAVARLLDGQPSLRRALSDAGVPPADRAAIARRVFAGKVSETAADLVETLGRQRWSRPLDLVEAVQTLATEAALDAAD